MTTATASRANSTGPVDAIGTDLMRTLRVHKPGQNGRHPARTAHRTRGLGHSAFLELVLSDEVTRRESRSAMLRARTAGLDPNMRLDTWTEPPDLRYDRALLSALAYDSSTAAIHESPSSASRTLV